MPGDPRRANNGGKKAVAKEIREAILELSPLAIARLEQVLRSKDDAIALEGIKVFLHRLFGGPNNAPLYNPAIPDDRPAVEHLEARLHAQAMAGDTAALSLALKAENPEKYVRDKDEDPGNTEPRTVLRFVPDGAAREGHKPGDADG